MSIGENGIAYIFEGWGVQVPPRLLKNKKYHAIK